MDHGLLISLSHLIYHQYMHFKYYWRKFMLGLIFLGLCLKSFILIYYIINFFLTHLENIREIMLPGQFSPYDNFFDRKNPSTGKEILYWQLAE